MTVGRDSVRTASPRHCLLVRRHLKTGDLAFHYCWVPGGQLLTKTRLIRAAGLRWHIEECLQQAKGEAGLDQYQVRTWRAWYAHITLSMLALAWLAASRAQAGKKGSVPATRA